MSPSLKEKLLMEYFQKDKVMKTSARRDKVMFVENQMMSEEKFQIFWPNIIPNKEIITRASCTIMTTIIQNGRWKWLGMKPEAPPLIATGRTADGKRKRGQPKETW